VNRFNCDPQYIEALGRAVYNFAILELNIVYIIDRLESGYATQYFSGKKTAGQLANDFDGAVKGASGHLAETELLDLSKAFRDLKVSRDKLLHAKPVTAPGGTQQLHYPNIAWDLDSVRKAATDFAEASTKANKLFHGPLKP
jgi:hypothetical protein